MKKVFKMLMSFLLRFGLSAVLLWFLYKQIDMEKTLEVVKVAQWKYAGMAFVLFIMIHVVLLLRWSSFIDAFELKVSALSRVRYFLIGLFGNLFLPSAIGGDVIKTVGLCRYSEQRSKIVASVLLDCLSGFAGIVVMATGAFLLGFHLIEDIGIAVSIVLMAIGSFSIGLILFHEGIYSFCCRIFSAFPKLKDGLMKMHYDIALLKEKRYVFYQSIAWSCLSQMLLAVSFFLIAKALHQDVLLHYFFIFVPLVCVASSVPSIGGLGVREAGAAYLLGKVGVASGVAVSISLVNFLFMVIVGLLGGVFFLCTKPPVTTIQDKEPLAQGAV